MTPVYFAFAANICFSIAILFYTSFSFKTTVLWTNTFKALIALIAFALTVSAFFTWNPITLLSAAAFILSGAIGLGIGDMFLLKAFTVIGPSRSMVLFGFQPLFLAITAFYFFDQPVPLNRFLAVFFLIGCLVSFSIERYRTNKDWGLYGIALALAAVLLDAAGILLTRYAFDLSPQLHAFEGNFYRCAGALLGLGLLNYFYQPIKLKQHFVAMEWKTRVAIFAASILGTFVSLGFYLQAVKTGHLASVSAIAITGPFFTAFFEYIYNKTWPSRFFILAFILFSIGFYLLNW